MKLPTLAAVALTTLLTACAGAQGSGASGGNLSTAETQIYSFDRLLPLPVATKPGDTLYRNPMLGIDVLEVVADGRPLTAEPSLRLFLNMDTTSVNVHSGTYLYIISLNRMYFFKRPNLSLVEYSIPEGTDDLVIRYRLVPYDGEPAPRVYTVTARRVG